MKPQFAFDPVAAVAHLRAVDPRLAEVIDGVPFALELRPVKSVFEALMRSIIYQQLHGRAAQAIHGRVVAEMLKDGRLRLKRCSRSPTSDCALPDFPRASCARSAISPRGASTAPCRRSRRRGASMRRVDRAADRGAGRRAVDRACADDLLSWPWQCDADRRLRHPRRVPPPLPQTQGPHARAHPQARAALGAVRSVASWYLWRSLDTEL